MSLLSHPLSEEPTQLMSLGALLTGWYLFAITVHFLFFWQQWLLLLLLWLLLLLLLVPQCPQSFFMNCFVFPFCLFIKWFSDTTFQMVNAQPSGCRDRDHMSEGYTVLWYCILWQKIKEFCRSIKHTRHINCWTHRRDKMLCFSKMKLYRVGSVAALSALLVCLQHQADPFY